MDATTSRRRKAHHKVKTGCLACKTRRQKCDEHKPRCAGCRRHSTDCLYVHPEHLTQLQVREARHAPVLPRTTPPLSPSRDLNLDDLELLHQYMTSTSVATAQLPQATVQRQTAIPQLAQTHPFVMRGILAQAAVHLSRLRPNQKTHYALLAARHHSSALPEFRSSMQNMTQNNHRALILFSKGLVWCSFAWYDGLSITGSEAAPTTLAGHADWLPSWFRLLRGSCLIVDSCRQWIQSGLHLMPPPLDDGVRLAEFADGVDSHQLHMLRAQLEPLTTSPIAPVALDGLYEAFARAFMSHHNTPLRNAMNYWVGMISDEYIALLQRGEPWALVILAHFSILVSRSETRWFMEGHASELLHSIVQRLPVEWQQYVQWPCEEVGLSTSHIAMESII